MSAALRSRSEENSMTLPQYASECLVAFELQPGEPIAAIRQFGEPPRIHRTPPKAANDSGPGGSGRTDTGLLVLVVDDDPEHCAYMAEVLARRGCRVGMSLSGREAINRLEREPFDAVVTDVYMPDLDGIELVRALRERWPALKVVAVTGGGLGHPAGVPNFLKYLGVSAILSKPFEPRELVEAIEKAEPGDIR